MEIDKILNDIQDEFEDSCNIYSGSTSKVINDSMDIDIISNINNDIDLHSIIKRDNSIEKKIGEFKIEL